MADPRIGNAAAVAACDAIVDLVDAGLSNGYIEIRTGAAPTNVDAAATGTLLATLPMQDPAFGAAADANPGGRATANAITDDSSADATGTAGYFRIFDSNGNARIQGDVTVTAGGGDMEMNSVAIQAGAAVAISSLTVTVPES